MDSVVLIYRNFCTFIIYSYPAGQTTPCKVSALRAVLFCFGFPFFISPVLLCTQRAVTTLCAYLSRGPPSGPPRGVPPGRTPPGPPGRAPPGPPGRAPPGPPGLVDFYY